MLEAMMVPESVFMQGKGPCLEEMRRLSPTMYVWGALERGTELQLLGVLARKATPLNLAGPASQCPSKEVFTKGVH